MYLCGDCFALGEGCQRKYVECSDHIITSNLVNNKFELSIRSLWIKERVFSKSHQSAIPIVLHAYKCTTHTHDVGFYEYMW